MFFSNRLSNVCGQPLAPSGRKKPYTHSTPLRLPNSLLDLSLPGTILSGCGAHHPWNPAHKRTTNTENADNLQDAGQKYELNIYFLLFIFSLSCHSLIPSRSGFPLVQGASILCTRPSLPFLILSSIPLSFSCSGAGGKHILHSHSSTTLHNSTHHFITSFPHGEQHLIPDHIFSLELGSVFVRIKRPPDGRDPEPKQRSHLSCLLRTMKIPKTPKTPRKQSQPPRAQRRHSTTLCHQSVNTIQTQANL